MGVPHIFRTPLPLINQWQADPDRKERERLRTGSGAAAIAPDSELSCAEVGRSLGLSHVQAVCQPSTGENTDFVCVRAPVVSAAGRSRRDRPEGIARPPRCRPAAGASRSDAPLMT